MRYTTPDMDFCSSSLRLFTAKQQKTKEDLSWPQAQHHVDSNLFTLNMLQNHAKQTKTHPLLNTDIKPLHSQHFSSPQHDPGSEIAMGWNTIPLIIGIDGRGTPRRDHAGYGDLSRHHRRDREDRRPHGRSRTRKPCFCTQCGSRNKYRRVDGRSVGGGRGVSMKGGCVSHDRGIGGCLEDTSRKVEGYVLFAIVLLSIETVDILQANLAVGLAALLPLSVCAHLDEAILPRKVEGNLLVP